VHIDFTLRNLKRHQIPKAVSQREKKHFDRKIGGTKTIPEPAIAAHESFYEVDFLSLMKFKFSLTFLHSVPQYRSRIATAAPWRSP